MKTILGAVAASLLMFAACGGDDASTTSPGGPGETAGGVDSGGADSGDDVALGGDAGASVRTPLHAGGDSQGGEPAGEAGDEAVGGGGASGNGVVSGHILTFYGGPAPGAVVMINGAQALTDEDGAFTLEDVPATYDVTVIFEGWHEIELVDGLTTRDLTLRMWQSFLPSGKAGVSGKLPVIPKGHVGFVQVVGEDVSGSGLQLAAGEASYALTDLVWERGPTAKADIVALEWTPGSAGPTSFDGFARQSVELSDGVNVSAANLTFSKPAQKTVTGTLSLDGIASSFGILNLGKIMLDLPLEAGAFSVVVPDIGEPATISVFGGGAEVTAPATSLTPLSLSLSSTQLPKLILPVGEAHADANTRFSFQRPGKLASVAWFTGSWIVVHVTDKTELTLPDLSDAGIAWIAPDDDGSTWEVDVYGPAETPEGFLQLMDGTSPAIIHSVTTTGYASRRFYLPR